MQINKGFLWFFWENPEKAERYVNPGDWMPG